MSNFYYIYAYLHKKNNANSTALKLTDPSLADATKASLCRSKGFICKSHLGHQ